MMSEECLNSMIAVDKMPEPQRHHSSDSREERVGLEEAGLKNSNGNHAPCSARISILEQQLYL